MCTFFCLLAIESLKDRIPFKWCTQPVSFKIYSNPHNYHFLMNKDNGKVGTISPIYIYKDIINKTKIPYIYLPRFASKTWFYDAFLAGVHLNPTNKVFHFGQKTSKDGLWLQTYKNKWKWNIIFKWEDVINNEKFWCEIIISNEHVR